MKSEKSLIDLCLGSPTKIRILATLSAWKGKDLTELQLAAMSQISGFGVRHALGDLSKSGIITKKIVGRANIWSLNESSYAYDYVGPIVEQIRKVPKSPLEFVKDQIRTLPKEDVEKIILFGSAIRASRNPASLTQATFRRIGDIDVAVILKKKVVKSGEMKEAIEETFSRVSGFVGIKLGKRLELHIFTPEEWDETNGTPLWLDILKGKEIYRHEKN